MSPAVADFRAHLSSIFDPPDTRTPVEWAEQEVWLSERQTQYPGPFSVSFCPYFRDIINLAADTSITDVTIVAGTQLAKTTSLVVMALWRIEHIPAPAMWVMPSKELAQSFSENRLLPLVEDSPTLAASLKPGRRGRRSLSYQFSRAPLELVGSNSPSQLASRPVGILSLDEVDKYADETDSEAAALELAEERTKSFSYPLRLKSSTPTLETGPITKSFKKGTQEYYHVPCPHCGNHIRLLWKQVKWAGDAKDKWGVWNLRRVKETAHYACQDCGGKIDDAAKAEAVQNGEWVATNPNAPEGHRSFQISSLYGLHRSCSFGALAVKFLEEKEAGNLRNFINSTLGEPWVQKGATIGKSDVRDVAEHSPDYILGEIPRDDLAILSLTVDVQQACFWWIVRAWFADSSSALIEYGQAVGWSELVALNARQFPFKSDTTKTAQVTYALIDSGYRAKRQGGVYDFCLGDGSGAFYPCQGRTEGHRFFKSVAETEIEHKGQNFRLIQFSDTIFKHDLYIRRIKERSENNWWLPRNIGRDYEEQVTDEYLKEERDGSFTWDTKTGANHLGDCEKMQLIVPSYIGSEKLRDIYEARSRAAAPAVDTPSG